MNPPARANATREVLTVLGAVIAAAVVIAGLVFLALLIFFVVAMNNLGSNK
jgi:hypothetical protein